MPDFEVLVTKIASALNRIIHNIHFKSKVSLEEQKSSKRRTVFFVEDRSLTWSTSTSGSLEPLILSRIMPTYLQLFFEMMILRNSTQSVTEIYCPWKNPIWRHLEVVYKLRIRESEKLKTVSELYNMEVHQKKIGPDQHRLRTMVKRSIEQDIRNKNFGDRNGNDERNAVVKNQVTKQRGQRTLGECWQWETNGQCVKGDNCSFRHDMNKRGKMTQSKRLRILSCSRMSEKHREPVVPGKKSQW